MIDSHLHVGLNGLTLEKLIRYLDAERIDQCWLLTWEEVDPGPWDYRHLPVEEVLAAHLKYPDRIIPFYAPDPHRTDAAAVLSQWHANGVRGCGELKTTLGWDSTEVRTVLATAEQLGMPVVFHMEESGLRDMPFSDSTFDRLLFQGLRTARGRYKVPRAVLQVVANHYKPLRERKRSYMFPGYLLDFASLEQVLREYPALNMVAHGPMFWRHIEADPGPAAYPTGPIECEGIIWRLLREYSNLYADISARSGFNALSRDRATARRFVGEFSQKVLYGTDNVFVGQRAFLESLDLAASQLRAILGDNAARLITQ